MRRLSALVMLRRLATGTTSESMLGDNGRADTGASSVALRAPCDAPVSTESPAACICALGCLLIFIPTSVLSKLTGVGVASHSGTGGTQLDFSGIDCSLDPQGRILIFETNATMLVHDEKSNLYAHKNPYVQRIKHAFNEMLEKLARQPHLDLS